MLNKTIEQLYDIVSEQSLLIKEMAALLAQHGDSEYLYRAITIEQKIDEIDGDVLE